MLMEHKILNILSHMQEQMNRMELDISGLKTDVSDLKSTVKRIEASVIRIEEQQNEDIIAMLHSIDNKTEVLKQRQDETDSVIDVLAARTIRLEAKINDGELFL